MDYLTCKYPSLTLSCFIYKFEVSVTHTTFVIVPVYFIEYICVLIHVYCFSFYSIVMICVV
jgi:hypothetical protein